MNQEDEGVNCAIGIAQFQNSLLDCYITAKSTYQSAIIFVNEFVQLATAQVASATFKQKIPRANSTCKCNQTQFIRIKFNFKLLFIGWNIPSSR